MRLDELNIEVINRANFRRIWDECTSEIFREARRT